MILPSPEIWHRNDFADLCNWRKLWTAIEVGVDRGEFSQAFLNYWRGHNFIGIDNYEPHADMPWNRDGDFQVACLRYERHAQRAKLIKAHSVQFAKQLEASRPQFFGGKPTQFVYIDGAHDYESVAADLAAWWPVVSPDGILAGHDYDDDHPGVMRAVQEFADRENVTVYLTTHDSPPSWYAYKTGMPGADWIRNPREAST